MKSTRYVAAACVALSVTLPAVAQVTVGDPWIRGTVPQQMSTGAFMQLSSKGGVAPHDGSGRVTEAHASGLRGAGHPLKEGAAFAPGAVVAQW